MTQTPSMIGTQKEVTYSHGYKKKEVVKPRGVYIVGVCTRGMESPDLCAALLHVITSKTLIQTREPSGLSIKLM